MGRPAPAPHIHLHLRMPRRILSPIPVHTCSSTRLGSALHSSHFRHALRGIHDVFHVSLLKPYKDNGMAANAPPVEIEKHEEYEIEKIL